jgi:hypothetical protein
MTRARARWVSFVFMYVASILAFAVAVGALKVLLRLLFR